MKENFFIKYLAIILGILIGYFGFGWLINFNKSKPLNNTKKNIIEMKLIYKTINNDTVKMILL